MLTHGAHFEINTDRMADAVDEEIFDYAAAGSDDEDEATNDYNEEANSPWLHSFQQLKEKMIKIPNENIYKRIITEGDGEVMGPTKCRVRYSYNYFFEYEKNAFDSSYFSGKNSKIMNFDEVMTGIWAALETMKKDEESQFIIDYKLMFGEFGCPPRIKPKADVLVVMKLLNFVEVGDENACDNVSAADRRKFVVMKPNIIEQQKRANDHFANKRFIHARRVNQEAIRHLELCQVADDKEQNEQQKLLIQLYTSLCDCYLETEDWKKVCSMINELRRLTDIKRNVKLLVNEGIALSKINDEFDRSIELLKRAQQIEPNNQFVNQTLNGIIESKKKYESERKAMWQRAFQVKQSVEQRQQTTNDAGMETKFKEIFQMMDENNEIKSIPLVGYTQHELDTIEQMLVNDLKRKLSISYGKDGKANYSINKLQ